MTTQDPFSYIFSDVVKILIGKKLSVQRGKKTLGPGVTGVGKKRSEEKEGSKAYCRQFFFLVWKKKEVPDRFSYVNTRMQLIKLKLYIIISGNSFISTHLSNKQNWVC